MTNVKQNHSFICIELTLISVINAFIRLKCCDIHLKNYKNVNNYIKKNVNNYIKKPDLQYCNPYGCL